MATALGLYNAALIANGDETLSTVTDDVASRRTIDTVYSDVLADCLEAGLWNFAKRTGSFASDTGISPNFGEAEIIAKPTDWVRTMKVSLDDRFAIPYLRYTDEIDYWASEDTPLYIQYVSNNASYGLNLTAWPRSFTRYVELELALRINQRLTQSNADYMRLEKDRDRAKRNALNKDAMNEPTQFPPSGSWTSARGGGGQSRRDRGNRSSLIG